MNYLVKESPMISAEEAPIEAPQPVTPMPWLTGEVLLYTLIVLIAAGLRFAQLDIYPLNDAEAAQAMVGYQISNGQTPTVTSGYSPFIATLNSFAFLLFDDSDGAARLGPALLGIVLVLLPIRLRRRLGVFGSLAASALLALSASTVFWSRTASGEMAVAVGGLMIWVAAVDWFEARSRFSVFMAATGLVLLLTGAPSAFTLLTILIALIIFTAATNRAALNAFPADLVQIGLTIGQVVLFGIALLIVLGTAALFNLSGLAAISDMFTVWLNQFGFQPQPGAAYPAFLMLLFYEPLLVIFGLVAII
jgi:predicted membrane-bound mannosyltransferase